MYRKSKSRRNNPNRGIIERNKYVRRSIKKIPKEKFCSTTKYSKENI